MQWFEGVQGTLLERSGNEIPLFPCALPYPEILDWEILTGEGEAQLWWAKSFVNTFVAWSNFVVLGSPRLEGGACEPRVGYRSMLDARLFCDRLLGEVQEFACHDVVLGSLECGGKRAIVEDLLQNVVTAAGACYGAPAQAGTSATTALPVVAARVAVPEEAGAVDPLVWLPEGQAAVLANLPELRLPEDQWDEVAVACHQVAEMEEKNVAAKLLATGVAVLVPESELPRRGDGRLLTGGLFGVSKNSSEDRLIYDRRPENSTMPRLDWASLPSGACYTRMLLQPNEYLRGSGDDLRNYYYALKLPENWIKYNSVGRRVDKSLVATYGGDPSIPYRLCFRVLGMGDTNGCAIAQATHEAVLKSAGLLAPEVTLKYGDPVPKSDLWEGVYLDDLLITLRMKIQGAVPLDGTFVPPPPQEGDPDVQQVRNAEEAYDKAGLQRAIHKSFRMLCQFRAWGAEVDGVTGKVGAPLQVRREVWKLIALVVRLGWATKNVPEKINGFICFICQYRREMFSLQHHIYRYVADLPQDRWCRLPGHIRDELRSVALHLPWATWNMRRSLSCSLLATDATPTSGGAVRANITPRLAQELWVRSEIRGEAIRLDRSEVSYALEPEPSEASRFVSSLAECLDWRVTGRYSFRSSSHINLQELLALRREIVKLASDFEAGGQVQLAFNDSRVAIGAVAKGRSSSYKVNGLLRAQLPFLVMGNLALALLWIETESNLADHPSRFRELPAPKSAQAWMEKYGVSGRKPLVGIEVFAGSRRITIAHKEVGIEMFEPVDLCMDAPDAQAWVEQLIRGGVLNFIWLAPPRRSFSRLRTDGAGTFFDLLVIQREMRGCLRSQEKTTRGNLPSTWRA